jgi:hypothetical protein
MVSRLLFLAIYMGHVWYIFNYYFDELMSRCLWITLDMHRRAGGGGVA